MLEKIQVKLRNGYYRLAYPGARRRLAAVVQGLTNPETLALLRQGYSLARFGDGEIAWVEQKNNTNSFGQKNDPVLAQRLRQVLASREEKLLVSIPLKMLNTEGLISHTQWSLRRQAVQFGRTYRKYIHPERHYADTFITRNYLEWVDKSQKQAEFDAWKQVWAGRDVVVMEGEKTRIGVGNDLLSTAASVRRILVPAENAWTSYDAILAAAQTVDKGCLLLLAIGPTATVLAYDLCCAGYQAVDIGHLDIEYEWLLRGAQTKMEIPGKYVNEVRQTHREGYTGNELALLPPAVQQQYTQEILMQVGSGQDAMP